MPLCVRRGSKKGDRSDAQVTRRTSPPVNHNLGAVFSEGNLGASRGVLPAYSLFTPDHAQLTTLEYIILKPFATELKFFPGPSSDSNSLDNLDK